MSEKKQIIINQGPKMRKIKLILLLLLILCITGLAQDATEIIRKSDELMRAKSSIAEMSMQIIKPEWSREMRMKVWALEPDFTLVLITAPARDRGTVTLKRKQEVWNYLPSVRRTIKIPPSMMLQGWMGSDFTNDDLVRQSSIVVDYKHTLVAKEKLDGYDCYKIKMIPRPEAGVVWGKVLIWITQKGYMQLRAEYYDEDDLLVKTMRGTAVKKMDGRTIPTHWEMVPAEKQGQKTVLIYHSIRFNPKIRDSFFSLQNMKRLRP